MEQIKEVGNVAMSAVKELPSNETVISGIDKAKKALRQTVLESDLSTGKKKWAKEVESILESAETFLQEKNSDNSLQNFFSDSKKIAEELSSGLKEKDLKEDLDEIMKSSKDLFFALIRDKELRELMMNSIQLIHKFVVSVSRSKGIEVPEELLDRLGMGEATSDSNKKRKTNSGKKKTANKKVTEKEMKELGEQALETLQSFKEKEEFQNALDAFFTLFKHVSSIAKHIKKNPEFSNGSLKKMMEDGRKVLEGFTGQKSLENLFGSYQALFELDSDDLKEYLSSWGEYLAEIKENPEILTGKGATKKMGELIHKAKDLFQEDTIRDAFGNFFSESWNFISSITPDNLGSKFMKGAEELMHNLYGKEGKISLSSIGSVLPQVKSLLAPMILSQLDNLPLPKLEGKTDSYSWGVEGIRFSASDIKLEHFGIDFHTKTDINVKELSNELAKAELTLSISGIKSLLKDIGFEYKRESFPAIQDEGKADITLGGEGATLVMKWYLESEGSNAPQITEAEVLCEIDKLDIFVKQAHHETLDSVITSLFSGFLKHKVEKQVEANIIKLSTKIAVELNKIFSNGKEEEKPIAK